MHLAKLLKDAGGVPGLGQRAVGVERRDPVRLGEPGVPQLSGYFFGFLTLGGSVATWSRARSTQALACASSYDGRSDR